jgi:hypothetical protein
MPPENALTFPTAILHTMAVGFSKFPFSIGSTSYCDVPYWTRCRRLHQVVVCHPLPLHFLIPDGILRMCPFPSGKPFLLQLRGRGFPKGRHITATFCKGPGMRPMPGLCILPSFSISSEDVYSVKGAS